MTDWENYESGPFCRHWGDPSDCDIKCSRCGHRCTQHGAEDGDYACLECDCEGWVEPEHDESFGALDEATPDQGVDE